MPNNLFFMKTIEEFNENDEIDIFILAAHTDYRSYSAYETLLSKQIKINKTIIFDYVVNRPIEETKLQENYYRLTKFPNVEYISCESNEANCEYISTLSISEKSNIFVDITNIVIPDIFRLFFVLSKILGIQHFNVIYSEPKYYKYLNGFYFKYEKEIAQREYKTIPEFFSSAVSRNVIFICFIGFERLVSKYVHDRKEHSDVLVINGFPAFYPKMKDISIEHNYELISAIGPDCIRYTQANDPFSAYNELTAIMNEYPNELLDICVLGSKPMALGACVFALKNPDVAKVSFPFPLKPQKHSSIDVSMIWWYKIII